MENRGCCGLDCSACDAYIATRTNDEELKARVARQWTQAYGFQFETRHINCTGCLKPGAKVGHCGMCEVRRCATAKGLPHCGLCEDYPCELGAFVWDNVPEAAEFLSRERG
ncbi:MAG: DUF3795 domain-containing protein [Pyramidobacter sp.]|nr:DUF3795 domain-containing protein [Pyramidobacter sp.]